MTISNVAEMMIYFFYRVKDIVESRKCWLPAFSAFPTMFSMFFKERIRGLCGKGLKTLKKKPLENITEKRGNNR